MYPRSDVRCAGGRVSCTRRMDANPIVLDETAGDVRRRRRARASTTSTPRRRCASASTRRSAAAAASSSTSRRATFVDSSVLGALLDARRRAIEAEPGLRRLRRRDASSPACSGSSTSPASSPCCPSLRGRDEAIEAARSANGARRMTGTAPPEVLLTMPGPARGRRRRPPGAGRHGRRARLRRRRAGRHEDGGHRGLHERRRPRLRRATRACSRSRCSPTRTALTIVVRDHGARHPAARPRAPSRPRSGLGLPLIAALSDAFELRGSAGHRHRGAHDLRLRARRRPRARRTRSPAPSAPTAAGTRTTPPTSAERGASGGLAQRVELAHAAERGRAPSTRSGARARA